MRLSKSLQPIYDHELSRGNEVVSVDEGTWSRSQLVIWFRYPLDVVGIKHDLTLPSSVRQYESRDPHYPLEIGYVDEETRHCIGGPITGEFAPPPEPLRSPTERDY